MPDTQNPSLDLAVDRAAAALVALQKDDGHFLFELEADATIPAEYILLQHYLGEIDDGLNTEIATFLRSLQADHGGWPLFFGGELDLSCSIKAYFALKAAGDAPDAPHMVRARAAILERGGAARANVFTRIQLALFGEISWKTVPVMPVEIMELPRWFPFHLTKVSYWSRTVIVPLLVLMAKKPRARNPRGITVQELFVSAADIKPTHAKGSVWATVFNVIDAVLRVAEPFFPKRFHQRAIDDAVAFVTERLNGEDGLGAIYPAMANTVMMFDCLGVPPTDPRVVIARAALKKLLVRKPGRTYCQPCLSPVWDSGLAAFALMEAGSASATAAAGRALDWLVTKQETEVIGDWATWRPHLKPGGWAFQYANPHYPDLDDAAMVALALDRFDRAKYSGAVKLAAAWLDGMQSRNGGWAAFDADNTYYYLNYIPFADHGALLDPPTADVSARCVGFFGQIGGHAPALARGIEYLRREQEADGAWFGRWGTNYIYGIWSVLCALNGAAVDKADPMIRRAVAWLVSKQRPDGGWGEDGRSYWQDKPRGEGPVSTPSQTAWALLALMAAGEARHDAVARGVAYLLSSQNAQGLWDEEVFTAVGFPRVFYLRYHGYCAFFPLWALARYRNLARGNRLDYPHGL